MHGSPAPWRMPCMLYVTGLYDLTSRANAYDRGQDHGEEVASPGASSRRKRPCVAPCQVSTTPMST